MLITPLSPREAQIQPVMPPGMPVSPVFGASSSPTPTNPARTEALPSSPQATASTASAQVISNLHSFVRGHWERAKQERISSGIEERMIRAKQARALEYDAKKRAEIAGLHGKDWEPPYMPVIETKCRALEDHIMDVYFQAGTRPFGVNNTPDPDMPPELEQMVRGMYSRQIAEAVVARHEQEAAAKLQAGLGGGTLDPQAMAAEIESTLTQQTEAIHQQALAAAKRMTEKFEIRVDDRLLQGGWYTAMREVVRDISTYPAAFVKGPEEHMIPRRTRPFDSLTGKRSTVYRMTPQEQFFRVSPINLYPLVGSRTCQDGLIERTQYSPMDLQGMLGVEGFNDSELRAVLSEAGNGALREWTTVDSRILALDNKSANTMYMGDNVDALIFWGQAPGRYLIEWGINGDREIVTDPTRWYRVYCILIGNHVVMARLNPNPDGRINYYKASFIEDPDKFWGQAIPDILWGHQVTANAVFRACGINAAMASGPIIEQNTDRCNDDSPLYPFKRFKVTDDQMKSNTPAIRMYNVQLIADRLTSFYEFLMNLCDFDSGVPRFSHGGEASKGIDTASGQAMQIAQASRGVKAVIEHMDRGLTAPSVQAEAYYLVDNDDSAEPPAGDLQIVATGSSALIVKEQATLRLNDFLARTNNPVDMQIIGLPGRRQLLRDAMKSLPIDRDKVVPEDQAYINQVLGTGADNTEIPPASDEAVPAVNPAGNRVAGRDFALMQGAGAGVGA